MKKCPSCSIIKPKTDFAKCKTKKDGLQSNCKTCKSAYYKENKDKTRDTHYKYRFGISIEEYEQLLASQNGCCALCGKLETENKRRLAVDHCHATGKVRKLLCDRCNVLLGHAKDDIEILTKAISYLKEHNFD